MLSRRSRSKAGGGRDCRSAGVGQRARGAGGFTLIEALVALAVVAAVLASVGGAIAASVRGTRTIDDRLALAGTAEALLTALPARDALRIGRQSGSTSGYRWQIEVSPMPVSAAAASHPWRPVAIDVRLQKEGGGPALDLKTVRLMRSAP